MKKKQLKEIILTSILGIAVILSFDFAFIYAIMH